MSKPAFTPGPWSAFIAGDTISIDIGSKPKGVAPCIVNWPGFDACGLPLDERKANARLIAASPLLYEALVAQEEFHQSLLRYQAALSELGASDEVIETLEAEKIAAYVKAEDLRAAALSTLNERSQGEG